MTIRIINNIIQIANPIGFCGLIDNPIPKLFGINKGARLLSGPGLPKR